MAGDVKRGKTGDMQEYLLVRHCTPHIGYRQSGWADFDALVDYSDFLEEFLPLS
jgi:hypothetical protein